VGHSEAKYSLKGYDSRQRQHQFYGSLDRGDDFATTWQWLLKVLTQRNFVADCAGYCGLLSIAVQ